MQKENALLACVYRQILSNTIFHGGQQGTAKTVFVYSSTARCLSSRSAAALPCLTQRVEHFGVFQVLYSNMLILCPHFMDHFKLQAVNTKMVQCAAAPSFLLFHCCQSSIRRHVSSSLLRRSLQLKIDIGRFSTSENQMG